MTKWGPCLGDRIGDSEVAGNLPEHRPADLRRSALDLKVLCRRLAFVRDLVVLDNLPLIQTGKAGLFDGRDVDEHILSAAALRLDKSIPLFVN
jgi:hypothetical protein